MTRWLGASLGQDSATGPQTTGWSRSQATRGRPDSVQTTPWVARCGSGAPSSPRCWPGLHGDPAHSQRSPIQTHLPVRRPALSILYIPAPLWALVPLPALRHRGPDPRRRPLTLGSAPGHVAPSMSHCHPGPSPRPHRAKEETGVPYDAVGLHSSALAFLLGPLTGTEVSPPPLLAGRRQRRHRAAVLDPIRGTPGPLLVLQQAGAWTRPPPAHLASASLQTHPPPAPVSPCSPPHCTLTHQTIRAAPRLAMVP